MKVLYTKINGEKKISISNLAFQYKSNPNVLESLEVTDLQSFKELVKNTHLMAYFEERKYSLSKSINDLIPFFMYDFDHEFTSKMTYDEIANHVISYIGNYKIYVVESNSSTPEYRKWHVYVPYYSPITRELFNNVVIMPNIEYSDGDFSQWFIYKTQHWDNAREYNEEVAFYTVFRSNDVEDKELISVYEDILLSKERYTIKNEYLRTHKNYTKSDILFAYESDEKIKEGHSDYYKMLVAFTSLASSEEVFRSQLKSILDRRGEERFNLDSEVNRWYPIVKSRREQFEKFMTVNENHHIINPGNEIDEIHIFKNHTTVYDELTKSCYLYDLKHTHTHTHTLNQHQ